LIRGVENLLSFAKVAVNSSGRRNNVFLVQGMEGLACGQEDTWIELGQIRPDAGGASWHVLRQASKHFFD
jgi:hypothetical protein